MSFMLCECPLTDCERSVGESCCGNLKKQSRGGGDHVLQQRPVCAPVMGEVAAKVRALQAAEQLRWWWMHCGVG